MNRDKAIIDKPGRYRMRNGGVVVVHTIADGGTYRAKGFRPPSRVGTKPVYDSWKVSGANESDCEHPFDIVEKVK